MVTAEAVVVAPGEEAIVDVVIVQETKITSTTNFLALHRRRTKTKIRLSGSAYPKNHVIIGVMHNGEVL